LAILFLHVFTDVFEYWSTAIDCSFVKEFIKNVC